MLDAETARLAILAGARFIVSPTFSARVVELCHRYDVVAMPGAYTPTELVTAWEAPWSNVRPSRAENTAG